MVHSLLFEAYKLVYFFFFSFFFLHNSPRLAYAICELYMFFQLLIINKVYLFVVVSQIKNCLAFDCISILNYQFKQITEYQ